MIENGTRIECFENDEIVIVKQWLKLQKAYLCELYEIAYNPDGSYGRNLIKGADYQILTKSDLRRRGANV